MLYELIEGKLTNRNRIVSEAEIDVNPFDGERYVSMFGFDHTILDWVEFNKTVSGFNGNYSCKYLYFDVDNEGNLEQSLESCRALVKALYAKLNINPKELLICFSGSKGFHVGINQKLFGGFEANKGLPDTIKILAAQILATCYDTTLAGIDSALKGNQVKSYQDVDLGIYNNNRIFRVINSKNAKSNLYKIGLTSKELFALHIEQIKTLAINARPEYQPETPVSKLAPNPNLVHLLSDALKFDPTAYMKDLNKKQGKGAAGGNFFAPPVQGNRNSALFAQACMLFDNSEFNEESVRQLISCINLAGENPLPEDEIRNIVKSAARRTANNEKKETITNPTVSNELETFNNWFDEWVDYYTKEQTGLTCLFQEIDLDNEYNYEGKLACFIGKGGSRKSFGAQNIIAANILNYSARTLYSTMEMGKVEVVNRLLDIIVDPAAGQKESNSTYLKGLVKQDKEGIRKAMKDTLAHINDLLILSNQSFMTCDDYEQMIKKTIELYGDIKILVVDGLSAMGGKGTETEVYSRNTLALKEIAKKYNLFVILICHTTKEAKPYDRDPKDKVRGSEKILDNADFMISFSQLIDEFTSTPDNINYSNSCGHIKYYNKRGTGKSINKVFFMNSQTKKIEETNRPAYDFPTYEEFISSYAKKQKQAAKDQF